jgi:dnd system-associated protein 4
MLFAACMGKARHYAVPFTQSAEPIRWETMIGRPGSESTLNMIAVTEESTEETVDRALVMSDERFDERAKIFEEYANGGLEILQSELARSPESPSAVVLKLVLACLDEEPDDVVPELDKLIGELGI